MFLTVPEVSILDYPKDILQKLEEYGRTAYKSSAHITKNSAYNFINGIIKSGHNSVLEHEKITVTVKCDRGISHQLARHRHVSITQESTRCNYTRDQFNSQIVCIRPWNFDIDLGPYTLDLVLPGGAIYERLHSTKIPDPADLFLTSVLYAEDAYIRMIRDGHVSPLTARSVLPTSLKTEMIITANIREWRYLLDLRSSVLCHPQMQYVAHTLIEKMRRVVPLVFDSIYNESFR